MLLKLPPSEGLFPGRLSSRSRRSWAAQPVAPRGARSGLPMAAATETVTVDQTLNPLVATLKVSKTMALTDLARSMRESGVDVS